MEDIKWFIKKFGIIFVILLVMIVSVGIFFEKNVRKSSAEETWEKPVQISDIEFWQEESDYERENEDNSPYWIIPQSKSLLSEEESKNIQNEALTAAEQVKVVYKDIVIIDDVPAYASGIDGFTNEQGEQVIKILGKSGYVCVKENVEMQNYDKLQNFYKSYLIGQDTLITVFVVQADGLLGAQTFVYRNEKLQSYYVGIRWREGGEPEILGTSVSDLSEIKFTEKGYFIYTFENPVAHAGLREYWRVKLLPEKCRELTEKWKEKYKREKQICEAVKKDLSKALQRNQYLQEEKEDLLNISERYSRVVRVLGNNTVKEAIQKDIEIEENRRKEQSSGKSILELLKQEKRKSMMENQYQRPGKKKYRGMEI